jgi:hypothetical protein
MSSIYKQFSLGLKSMDQQCGIILQKEVIIISVGVILELMPTCCAIQGVLFMSSHVWGAVKITLTKQSTLSDPRYVYISIKLTSPNTDNPVTCKCTP